MGEFEAIPQEACCKRCGYALRGLDRDVCPECGTGFDRRDPATYDFSVGASRKRRWIRRLVHPGLVALAILLVFPQGVLHGSIRFKCQVCGTTILVERWELRPPPWIPFRYPGRTRTGVASPTTSRTPCPSHHWDITAAFDFRFGSASTTRGYQPDSPITLNGRTTTPETAESVLKDLMHPSTIGIGP